MRGDICANSWLIEGVDIGAAAIEKAVDFQDARVALGAAEFVSGTLLRISCAPMVSDQQARTSKHRTKVLLRGAWTGDGVERSDILKRICLQI